MRTIGDHVLEPSCGEASFRLAAVDRLADLTAAAGTTKLVGTAQRLTRHGYLFSAVVLVTDPEPVREVLVDAYAALGLDWRPASVGAATDHAPGASVADVEAALLRGLRTLLPGLTEDATR